VIPEVLLVRVGRPGEKPEQLASDRVEQDLLGGQEWKPVAEVITRLCSEDREGPGPSAILATLTAIEDMLNEIEVLLHR
jgi:hypothetical protein